jgi:glycosyltransferase involved in cell wall biosynthesis
MRIGLYGGPHCGTITGIGRYVIEICRELDRLMPEATFVAYSPGKLSAALPSRRWSVAPLPLARWVGGLAAMQLTPPSRFRSDGLDVFWGTRTLLPRLPSGVASLSTVYDLNHKLVPASMGPVNRVAHALWFDRSIRKGDAIVAISRGTAERLHDLLGCRTTAIAPPACAAQFQPASREASLPVLRRYGLEAPYVLAVSTLEPRKNLGALVRAYEEFSLRSRTGLDLVLAGSIGWGEGSLGKRIREGLPGIRSIGYVRDEDLPALYSSAEAFVMPSIYEGYGMPAAEAAACGTRVVATDIPELREAAGPHAVFTAPTPESIAAGLIAALAKPRPPAHRSSSWAASAAVFRDAFTSLA